MSKFTGPLFIVGNPRSGTKLLKNLLNQNPRISLCYVETHFIPHFVHKYGDPVFLNTKEKLDAFYSEFNNLPFQAWNQDMGNKLLSRADMDPIKYMTSWGDICEYIIRFYSDEHDRETTIWGDKTPSYMIEMPLLKRLYPASKFIHIIRDPRDVALSAKKAWGHNLYRVATKWHDNLKLARQQAQTLGGDYIEVFYEDVITDSETTLQKLCDFLDVTFTPGMLSMLKPFEKLGDAQGTTTILQSNSEKYKNALTSPVQQRIEEIVYPVAKDLGYKIEYAKSFRPLTKNRYRFLKVSDGLNSLRYQMKDRGIFNGLRFYVYSRILKQGTHSREFGSEQ